MPTYVALLRAINVSGSRPVPMARLRDLCTGLGWQDVQTYLQSGNVVFQSPGRSAEALARRLAEAIPGEFGFDVDVLVRKGADFPRLLATNPHLAAHASEPAKINVAFLLGPPRAGALETLAPPAGDTAVLAHGPSVIFMYHPEGIGRSRLSNDYLERRLGVLCTVRNWNTVTALAGMVAGS